MPKREMVVSSSAYLNGWSSVSCLGYSGELLPSINNNLINYYFMLQISKFRDHGFMKKCNNAEYTSVANRIIGRTTASGTETLGVPEEFFTMYQAKNKILNNLVAQSRIVDETGKINEVEVKINNLLKYMFGIVRNARTTPIEAKKQAGLSLYNATSVYLKTYRLPQQQKLATVGGLLTDLNSDKLSAHISTLGMETELEQLTLLHAQFGVLLESRTNSQMLNSEEKSFTVRQDMDQLFELIITAIWVHSYTNPSEETSSYIKSVNKILTEAETAYNQRMAQKNSKENDETTDKEELPSDEEVPGEEQETDNE